MNEPVQGRMQASLVQGGTDTNQELFDIVDSIQEGFAASLEAAKTEKKTPEKPEKAALEEESNAAEELPDATAAAPVMGATRQVEPLKLPDAAETARQLADGNAAGSHRRSVLSQVAPGLRQTLKQPLGPSEQSPATLTAQASPEVATELPINNSGAAQATTTTEATPAPAPVVTLSSQESINILQNLQQLSQATKVQAPNPASLSTPLLDAIKGSNPQMARSLEAARPTGALAAVERAQAAQKAAKAQGPQQAKKPHTRLEELKEQVVKQVRHQMRLALRGSAQEVRMALRPGFLGNVKIRMLMEKSSLNASFVVENQTVREMLQRSADQLQELLADSGLDLESLEIEVADDALSGDGKQHASTEGKEAIKEWFGSVYRWTAADAEDALGAPSSDASSEDGLDLIV